MKCTISILIAALLSCTISHAQQLDTLIRGVFLFPRGNVSFDSIANRLHCNTVQFSSGYNESENEQGVLTNPNGVKVIHQRKFLESVSWGQRMEYDVPESLRRSLSPCTQTPDTILYLQNATVYFYDKDISRLKAI